MSKSTLLRGLITSPETLVMPDAYDPLMLGSSRVSASRQSSVQATALLWPPDCRTTSTACPLRN